MSSSTNKKSKRSPPRSPPSPGSTVAASQLARGYVPSAAPPAARVGQTLGEFHLLHELGSGSCGRVFLATQRSLSDRPLVLKLTARSEEEHLSLARLQHTYIVPLYLVQDFPDDDLRALCMPFVGGTAWSRLVRELRASDEPRSGRRLVELLTAAHKSLPLAPPQEGPALGFLARLDYVSAVCWIGACLADALQYAHQRGLLHLDIKPSNVLLAGDGQPMLLDFHLAQPIIRAGARGPSRLGGTPGYMAPELERAASDLAASRPIHCDVDGRADIHALGVLLYESLVGSLPQQDAVQSRARLRAVSGMTRGLEDIIYRCLASDPHDRYPDAEQLAADLRRHLTDLPLRGVPNRSVVERFGKWRRRQPQRLSWVHAVALLGVAAIVLTWSSYRHGFRNAEDELSSARTANERHDYPTAIEHARKGLEMLRGWPTQGELGDSLSSQLKIAQRARLAETLASLVERLRFIQDFDTLPRATLADLDRGCHAAWEARASLLSIESGEQQDEAQSRLRADLADLALLWAELRLHLAGPKPDAQVAAELSSLLDEMEQLVQPTPAIEIVRRRITGQARVPIDRRSLAELRSVWDYCAYGRELLFQGNLADARNCFERAIALEPDAFWPYFYSMICSYRERRFDDALRFADVAIALAPRQAECFLNRGLVEQARGNDAAAIRDFGTALELDPRMGLAALSRGTLLVKRQRPAEAISDLKRALAAGADPAAAYYQLALVELDRQDRAAALAHLGRALAAQPNYGPALSLRASFTARP